MDEKIRCYISKKKDFESPVTMSRMNVFTVENWPSQIAKYEYPLGCRFHNLINLTYLKDWTR